MNNEWEKEFDDGWARNNPEHPRIAKREAVKDFIRGLLTKERADWLRSEIEKLEEKTTFYSDMIIKSKNKNRLQAWSDFTSKKQALTSIITRYKEELLELDRNGV